MKLSPYEFRSIYFSVYNGVLATELWNYHHMLQSKKLPLL